MSVYKLSKEQRIDLTAKISNDIASEMKIAGLNEKPGFIFWRRGYFTYEKRLTWQQEKFILLMSLYRTKNHLSS